MSDMTSSAGKEGDDQHGDGRWLMMVRVRETSRLRSCSQLIFLIPAPEVYQRGQGWRARGPLGRRQSHAELVKFPYLGLEVSGVTCEAFTSTDPCSFCLMHSACFGISGDRTENVLWRLQNGELEDVSPKIIVLSVGQENYGDSPDNIAEGIKAICGFIRSKQPQAFLVLLVS